MQSRSRLKMRLKWERLSKPCWPAMVVTDWPVWARGRSSRAPEVATMLPTRSAAGWRCDELNDHCPAPLSQVGVRFPGVWQMRSQKYEITWAQTAQVSCRRNAGPGLSNAASVHTRDDNASGKEMPADRSRPDKCLSGRRFDGFTRGKHRRRSRSESPEEVVR